MNPETGTIDEDPVYHAVASGNEQELLHLLQDGVEGVNEYVRGDTALCLAVKRRNVYFVQLLVDYGANCACQDNNGSTPLHLAVDPEMLNIYSVHHSNPMNNREILMQLLIDGGADINARNIAMETPLHYAVPTNHGTAAQLLIDRGADMNAGNMFSETPLHYTAEHGNVEAMKLLIDKGAFMNARTGIRETPLHYAITYNKFECVRVLVLAGADMSPGYHNKSPLHMAVEKGNRVVARFLILYGCDTGILDHKHRTALQLCRTTEMTETLQDTIREVTTNRMDAVLMGHHPRLGAESGLFCLPPDLLCRLSRGK
jgi:ankyrin repeat protein